MERGSAVPRRLTQEAAKYLPRHGRHRLLQHVSECLAQGRAPDAGGARPNDSVEERLDLSVIVHLAEEKLSRNFSASVREQSIENTLEATPMSLAQQALSCRALTRIQVRQLLQHGLAFPQHLAQHALTCRVLARIQVRQLLQRGPVLLQHRGVAVQQSICRAARVHAFGSPFVEAPSREARIDVRSRAHLLSFASAAPL
mmetsp:Transcript_102478/g.293994  ORF Transcript_102478/g.293994 Transcript_102478/m.293994 type:complete len:200 (+) Transcript_102478:683-1282(+)